jgi:hypothetical protein
MEKLKENVKVLHAFEYQDLVPLAGKYLYEFYMYLGDLQEDKRKVTQGSVLTCNTAGHKSHVNSRDETPSMINYEKLNRN